MVYSLIKLAKQDAIQRYLKPLIMDIIQVLLSVKKVVKNATPSLVLTIVSKPVLKKLERGSGVI